ncbi:MAG: hypothetical protein O3A63_08485 [Proteobacteria bacterium]|nr:hypothetical protein [Pseudomonadota bacterium]
MDYIGIDPAVGLECSSCKTVSRLTYSELLNLVTRHESVTCEGCNRAMAHDWTTVSIVQNIIKKRMKQANEAKIGRVAQN